LFLPNKNKKMLSIEETKEFFKDENMSDEKAEEVRWLAQMFAEIAFEQWAIDQKKKKDLK